MQAGSDVKLYERFLKMSNGYILGSKIDQLKINIFPLIINYVIESTALC